MKLPCACPGSPEIVDGGGKDGRRPLGYGLEKRPPCPWLIPIEQDPKTHEKSRPFG